MPSEQKKMDPSIENSYNEKGTIDQQQIEYPELKGDVNIPERDFKSQERIKNNTKDPTQLPSVDRIHNQLYLSGPAASPVGSEKAVSSDCQKLTLG